MSVPLTIKIDLGIAECVEKIERIFEQRRNRNENFMRDLSDDLDAAAAVMKTLNDAFIKLARGFANQYVLGHTRGREELIEQTDKYLTDHDLLPELKKLKGRIAGSSMRGEVAKRSGLKPLLESLDREIERFILLLGPGGVTGVGRDYLLRLKAMALAAPLDPDKIAAAAAEALRNHDFNPSERVHEMVGRATALLR